VVLLLLIALVANLVLIAITLHRRGESAAAPPRLPFKRHPCPPHYQRLRRHPR